MTTGAFANFFVATPENVSVTQEGMFVFMEGAMVPVQSLNAANDGYIVAIPMPMCDICPNCGRNTYRKGGFCSVCGFPDDAKKAKK